MLLMAVACSGGGSSVATHPSQAIDSASQVASSESSRTSAGNLRAPVDSSTTSRIAIDAGGGAVGSWTADSGYIGGWSSSVGSPIYIGAADAASQSVYQTQRVGADITYTVPNLVARASYALLLHFAETWFSSAGQRVFGVTINGTQALSNFDIFQAAGGKNIAVVRHFNATADEGGKLTIRFAASINNAAIAGIEVPGGSSAAPPVSVANGAYPIYSSFFTGNTPFHHTVKQLMSAGATVLPSAVASHYWAEGISGDTLASHAGGTTPLFSAASGQPSYVFSCPAYGTCNANGLIVHFPSGAAAQSGSDHHLNSFDPVYLHGEVDGWGGDGNQNQACNLNSGSPGTATCSWGGFYPFSGSGLASSYSSANAGGYAFGLMDVAAGELLRGHIDHALGIEQSCLDDGAVYPSIIGRASDAHCPWNLEPNAKYGQLIHLKSNVDVGAFGYSRYCQVIVQALQTYGAYAADTNGSWGISLGMENPYTYGSANNPWFQVIYPSMVAGGDGSGAGPSMQVGTCLRRIPASNIEVIQISPNLPP